MESSHSRKDLKSHVADCPPKASPGEGELRKMLSRLDELKDCVKCIFFFLKN